MRIAFLVSEFPVLSETFVLNQMASLIELGHEVEILSENASSSGRNHDVVRRYHLMDKVTYSAAMPGKGVAGRLWSATRAVASCPPGSRRKLAGILSWLMRGGRPKLRVLRFATALLPGRRYDAVICHFGPNGATAVSLRQAGILKGPILTYFHGWDMSSHIRANGPEVYRGLFAAGDLFLPISDRWRKKLLDLGCEPARTRVHHMGIPVSRFQYVSRQSGGQKPVRLISVARLIEKKGIEIAIRALAYLVQRHRITYTIVGDGPMRAHLAALVHELGLANSIVFAGALPQQEVVRLLGESDILIAPSITAGNGDEEGIPVALMEAMATGLPVVSSRHSGIPELVEDGIGGLLAEEGNVESLAGKIALLLESPARGQEMGAAARKKVEREFNLEALSAELIDMIKGLALEHSGAASSQIQSYAGSGGHNV